MPLLSCVGVTSIVCSVYACPVFYPSHTVPFVFMFLSFTTTLSFLLWMLFFFHVVVDRGGSWERVVCNSSRGKTIIRTERGTRQFLPGWVACLRVGITPLVTQ